ncbi:MAG TPA: hypothetical protein VFD91_06300, partial [Mariniphaga sp.]|nr:hypothetical protein [Mariniphaga sp.]
MVISFGIKYGWLFLLLVLLAAIGIILLMYYRNKNSKELTRGQRTLLIFLRFISFSLIAFLLLSPFFQTLKRTVQRPLVIAAWDNSNSIVSTEDSVSISEEIKQIKNTITQTLGEEYRLVHYVFGQETSFEGDLSFSEKKSDYGNLFSTLTNNHFNEKIGAVIVAGDGIYNQGRNPLNMINNNTFPVYTIGIGDTTETTDARIQNIRVNRTAFSGNRFPVEIDVVLSQLQDVTLSLSISENGQQIAETLITAGSNNSFSTHNFLIDAGQPGLKQLVVEIEPDERERNTKNNQSSFVVNIMEDKQNILILSAGPHPDIGAIANTLEQQDSYDVTVIHEEPYPADLSDFNLIILHQLPTAGKSIRWLTSNELTKIPMLFIIGPKTLIPQFNALGTGVTIEPLPGSREDAQAIINPAFGTFTLSEQFRELVPGFPPLQTLYANYHLDPDITPLLYQKIKNIETGKPLVATGVLNGRKTGFIFGEGLWKWRLYNFYTGHTHNQFNELINQSIQYLALRENEDNFIINFEPVYAETDDVIFTAELYNDAFERVTGEEINITISNELNDTFHFTFDTRNDSYFLNAGRLFVGTYSFVGEVVLGEQKHT